MLPAPYRRALAILVTAGLVVAVAGQTRGGVNARDLAGAAALVSVATVIARFARPVERANAIRSWRVGLAVLVGVLVVLDLLQGGAGQLVLVSLLGGVILAGSWSDSSVTSRPD